MERAIMSWCVCGWHGTMPGSIILPNRILFKSVRLSLVGKHLSSFFWIPSRARSWSKCSRYFSCFCRWGLPTNSDTWRNRNRSSPSCIMNADFDMVIWFVRYAAMVTWLLGLGNFVTFSCFLYFARLFLNQTCRMINDCRMSFIKKGCHLAVKWTWSSKSGHPVVAKRKSSM